MESEAGQSAYHQGLKMVAVKKEEPAEDEKTYAHNKETVGGGDHKLGSANCYSSDEAMAKSGADTTAAEPERLTIFYGGNVVVLDGIPAEKAREIIAIAAAAAKAVKSTDIKKTETGPVAVAPAAGKPSLSRSLTMHSTSGALPSEQPGAHNNSLCKLQAELPIARRHSLQRFFEKRRDRMMSKSPYSIPSSPSAAENAKLDSGKLLADDHLQQKMPAATPNHG